MWHRFSVVLALTAASGVGSLGYMALSPQTVSAPLLPRGVTVNVDLDAVASSSYIHPNNRPGSGRRSMRGT